MKSYLGSAIRLLSVMMALVLSACLPTESAPNTVSFKIAEISSRTVGDLQEKTWMATHESWGSTAKFLISIQMTQPNRDTNMPFSFSKGSIAGVEGSDSRVLVQRLSAALMAREPKPMTDKVKLLPFGVAILGTGLSRTDGNVQVTIGASPGKPAGNQIAGTFSSTPAGNWIATKMFLRGGEGEVFLNLDPVGGVGEFSIKDPDYGDIVIEELSRVL
ncbi:hypothetical protein [Cupriavidus sp. YAF13]|uniref:hypothetical protein n=1 Tax=Cupriavidus sp. YAF13 TaxID=3233075 RepID=UPI003F91CF6C